MTNQALQEAAVFEAERRLTWLRLVVMASGTVTYPFLASRPGSIPWLAYSILALGWSYSIGVLVFEPYKRHPILLSAAFTTINDAIMTALWLYATGGVSSPWFIAIFPGIIAVSYRQTPKVTLLAGVAYAAAYVGMVAITGQLGVRPVELALRVFYALVTAAFAAIMTRERMKNLVSRVQLLDMTQEVAQVGSWEWSIADGRFQCSDELYRVFGLPLDRKPTPEVLLSITHPDDRPNVEAAIARALEEHEPFRFDHRITVDGRTRWVHCRGRVLLGPTGQPREMIGSVQDITERRHIQSQLLFAGKLASLGTLASGVAHEINNPLAYLSNNLDVIERHLQDRESLEGGRSELPEAIASARHGAARVREIVRGLRAYAHPNEEARGPLDVTAVADSAIAMVSHETEPRARIIRDYAAIPLVAANESRLSQVLVNLLVNAAQAIELGDRERNEIRVRLSTAADGRACIEIADTGSGIRPADIDRLFDPFFTTKPPGVGTGIGLSICHAIIRDLDGEIEVSSVVGKGSTFRVLIPATPEGKASEKDLAPPAERPSGEHRREPLLIIDDEPRYSTSLRMLLQQEYEVHVCATAREGLALTRSIGFGVILCDLMMPEMTGMELFAQLPPALRPRVVFLTGGATSDAARAFLARADVTHVEKPVELPALELVIRATLDRNRAQVEEAAP